jgi:hypothetical protein
MYIMAPEAISTAYCICIPLIIPRQQLGKHVPPAKKSHKNRGIVGRVVFYAVRVVSKKSLWVYLCIPLSLLGNDSVNTFPRQRIIVGGVVLLAVCPCQRKVGTYSFPVIQISKYSLCTEAVPMYSHYVEQVSVVM